MKIKNILIASSFALALVFSVSSGTSNAKPEKLVTFEEFVQDKVQFEKWEKEHAEHVKEIQELKDEKRVRTMEYKAFIHNPNADPSDISKAAREIVKLDRKIDNLNQEFVDSSRDKYGLDMGAFEGQRGYALCVTAPHAFLSQPCAPANCPALGRPAPKGCPVFGGGERPVPYHGMKSLPPHHGDFMKNKSIKKDVPAPIENEETQM